jgi:transposase
VELELDKLPSDVAELQELVRSLSSAVAAKEAEVAAKEAEVVATKVEVAAKEVEVAANRAAIEEMDAFVSERDAKIRHLESRVESLIHALFGRRSEKLDPGQLMLFTKAMVKDVAAAVADETPPEDEEEKDLPPPKRKGGGRRKLPEHLPRERIEIELPEEDRICGDCGGVCDQKIGEETSEQLDYVPASMVVRQFVRPKYACKPCQGSVVISPPLPQPIEKGIPGPGLLAKVLTDKYGDHLPLYRQEGIFARFEVDVARSTLCGWVRHAAELLEPIYDHMHQEMLASRRLHTDDTPVPVLRPGKGKTGTGRMWVYVGDEEFPHTIFDYTANRSRDGPLRFLADFEGYLQADAYAGYDELYRKGKVVEVACWAHARRYFFDARTGDTLAACTALGYIQRLYKIERAAKELSDDERRELRQEEARPILEDFGKWLEGMRAEALPRSNLGKAIGYVTEQWEALQVYTEHGFLRIDNNVAENAIRPVVLGRKNWLFAGSDRGGKNAAVIYSLVASCKRAGFDCFAYFRHVLEAVSTHPARRIAELTPAGWAAQVKGTVEA